MRDEQRRFEHHCRLDIIQASNGIGHRLIPDTHGVSLRHRLSIRADAVEPPPRLDQVSGTWLPHYALDFRSWSASYGFCPASHSPALPCVGGQFWARTRNVASWKKEIGGRLWRRSQSSARRCRVYLHVLAPPADQA